MRLFIYKKIFFIIFYLFPILIFSQTVSSFTQLAKKGVLDLRNEKNIGNKVIKLDGEWQFYYQGFLEHHQLDTLEIKEYRVVPSSSWSDEKFKNQSISALGFATYRLKILLPPNYPKKLAIRCFEQSSAFLLRINKKIIIKKGIISETSDGARASTGSTLEDFDLFSSNEIEILVHISNYDHRKGGLWHSLFIGEENKIRNIRENEMILDVFLLGALIIMSFYHILIFILRPVDKSALYFSVCCLLFLIRLSVTGDVFLERIIPSLSWEMKYKLEYGSLYFTLAFLSLFMRAVFPDEYSKKMIQSIVIVDLFFVGIVLFFSVIIYSHSLIYFHLFTFVVIIYSLYAIIKSVIRKRKGAVVFLLGVIILYLGAINDILFATLIINTFYILPISFLLFFFSQAALLSLRSSNAFYSVEKLSNSLTDINQNLEKTVDERGQELSNANLYLKQSVEELNTNLDIINLQKIEIYEKNKNLTDSLEYAKLIQQAILPDLKIIQKNLNNFFIYYQPKDIVSGDFYYFNTKDEKIIIAAVDCTGHGVPGAFMSLIGKQLLDQIIDDKNIIEPDLILNELHIGVRQVLRQQNTDNRDGMDVSLICIDKVAQKIMFAGAKNPLYFHQNNEWKEIKGDVFTIGGSQKEMKREFTKHTIDIITPTTLYLFSDGFQDQFGGEYGKKFLTKNFRNLLQTIEKMPLSQQQNHLETTMKNWWGEQHEPNDDILVIGIQID